MITHPAGSRTSQDPAGAVHRLVLQHHDLTDFSEALTLLAHSHLSQRTRSGTDMSPAMGAIIGCTVHVRAVRGNDFVAASTADLLNLARQHAGKLVDQGSSSFSGGKIGVHDVTGRCGSADARTSVLPSPVDPGFDTLGPIRVGAVPRSTGTERGPDEWDLFQSAAEALRIASVMTVNLDLEDEGVAVLSFYATGSSAFPAECRRIAETFAGVAARSLQLVLRWGSIKQRETNLRAALESRTVIDLALGMIMAQNRCTHQQAVSILKRASNAQNTRLHSIAERIVSAYNPNLPTTHFTN